MADSCNVKFNSGINVNLIKVSKGNNFSFDEAFAQKENMDTSTILFSNFINSIDAYYLSPEDVASGATFSIYKKTPNQKYYDYVCQLADGAYTFYDYNIKNGQYYHYLASVELETSQPNIYDYQIYENSLDGMPKYYNARFNEWTICNIEETEDEYVYKKTGHMWSLGLNFDEENITQGLNITKWDTLGRYNKVSIGEKKCENGVFSGLLGLMQEYKDYCFKEHGAYLELDKWDWNHYKDVSNIKVVDEKTGEINQVARQQRLSQDLKIPKTVYGYTEKMEYYDKTTQSWQVSGQGHEYSTEMDKLNAWKDFCADGELKLLRDIKGNGWIVQIVDSPSYTIENKSNLKQTKISFAWQEIKDINSCSIVSTDSTIAVASVKKQGDFNEIVW